MQRYFVFFLISILACGCGTPAAPPPPQPAAEAHSTPAEGSPKPEATTENAVEQDSPFKVVEEEK